jgi:hypothetical protein
MQMLVDPATEEPAGPKFQGLMPEPECLAASCSVAEKSEMQPIRLDPNVVVVINFLKKDNCSMTNADVLIEKLHELVEQSDRIPNNIIEAYQTLSPQNKWLLLEIKTVS